MQIRLSPGVWPNAASLGFGGAGAVTAATAIQTSTQMVGFAGMATGLALLVWGVRINERHVWQRWWKPVSDGLRNDEWMPFRDVVRRVALHTEWGISYTARNHSWPTWQGDLKDAVRGPLADGKVHARGKHDFPGHGEATGRTDLPADFWAYSDFDVAYLLVSNEASMARRTGKPPVEVATDIVMDFAEVERVWPVVSSRRREGRKSLFAALAQRWHDDRMVAFLNEQGQHPDFSAAFDEFAARGK